MRLPTIYETTLDQASSNLPTGDSGVSPVWAGVTNGVPGSGSTGRYWTASASTYGSSSYWIWVGTTITLGSYANDYLSNFAFRCVLPNSLPACTGDCYQEGTAPNYAQDFPIGTERIGPSGSTLTLQFATGSSGFKIWKEKGGTKILNATGLVANGWQQQLMRAGTAFSGTDFTNGANCR
jgi:hypothetical protein